MLVLSRKVGENIRIGHDIIVTIVDIRGGKVRLGVQAPDDVPVHRESIYKKIFEQEEVAEGEQEGQV